MENNIRKAIRSIIVESMNDNRKLDEGIFNLFNKNKTAPAAQPAKQAQQGVKKPAFTGGKYEELQLACQKATPQQIATWMGEVSQKVNDIDNQKKQLEKLEKEYATSQSMMSKWLEAKKKEK